MTGSASSSVQSSASSRSAAVCLPLSSSHEITNSEWAVARIFSFTDPRTVCRLACVNQTFLLASESDAVWKAFLSRLSRSRVDLESQSGESMRGISNKEMFFRLARSIPLHGGRQRYWVDPSSFSECYMLSARTLQSSWGDSPQYWEWVPRTGAWFPEVASLRAVCWFEIHGTFCEILSPGHYTVSFRMQLGNDVEDQKPAARPLRRRFLTHRALLLHQNRAQRCRASGWDRTPMKFSVRTSEGQEVHSERGFCEECFASSDAAPLFEVGRGGDDGWVECDAGEFRVEEGGKVEVEFAMEEIEALHWKHGLFLDGVVLRPSSCILRRDRVM